jgi:hypothetical protein
MDYITKYQQNWQYHVNRMNDCRIPKALLYYQPNGHIFGMANKEIAGKFFI